jgi:hypothetical protein
MPKRRTLADEVKNPEPVGPMRSIADQLLADLKPKEDFYMLRTKSVWSKFRMPRNTGDIQEAQDGMREFVFRIQEMQAKILDPKEVSDAPPPYEEALRIRPLDMQDLCHAYVLHYWSHPEQDGGKFTEPDCLRMVALDPYSVYLWVNQIDEVLKGGSVTFAFQGVAEKKAS